jgi:hypothetical protein
MSWIGSADGSAAATTVGSKIEVNAAAAATHRRTIERPMSTG